MIENLYQALLVVATILVAALLCVALVPQGDKRAACEAAGATMIHGDCVYIPKEVTK